MDNKIFFCSRNGKSEITDMITSYVRSTNGKKIIIFNGNRDSFRCRQRNKDKNDTFRFISYKKMLKERKKKNNRVYGPMPFYTISKL